jgi:hypothetical protein
MPSRSQQHETVTATGIRIVGQAAVDLATQAAQELPPPSPEDLLWVARFKARNRLGTGSAVMPIISSLTEAIRADWDGCPTLARDTPVARPAGRFHGLSWLTDGEPGSWIGELVWRHRHPQVAGVAAVTHLVIEEQQQTVNVTVSAAADGGLSGVRGAVGAGQSRPSVLDALRQQVTLVADGHDGAPVVLTESEVGDFVRNVLLDEARTWPVAVLAPLENDGYPVGPQDVARELFGLAPLYVMDRHVTTFRLTDEIGDKRLSAYFGALRVYHPEFTCADRSDQHWLLLSERAEDPLERAALVGKLGRFAVDRHLPINGIRERRARAVAAQVHSAGQHPVPAGAQEAATTAPETPQVQVADVDRLSATLASLDSRIAELTQMLSGLVNANALLGDEISRLRAATTVRSAGNSALERRLARMEMLLTPESEREEEEVEASGDGDDERETRSTLVDVVRHAGSEFGDALLMLESAERTAADSPYEDPDRLAALLQGMAFVARRRQEGRMDSGLRAAFQELGIDYRSGIAKSTSDRLRRQYQFVEGGITYDCAEHIAIGGTYDPRRCLRIYFTSRAPLESRFVIGHVGRHLTVLSTS